MITNGTIILAFILTAIMVWLSYDLLEGSKQNKPSSTTIGIVRITIGLQFVLGVFDLAGAYFAREFDYDKAFWGYVLLLWMMISIRNYVHIMDRWGKK